MSDRGLIKSLERREEKALCAALKTAESGDRTQLGSLLQAMPEDVASDALLRLARASTPSGDVNGVMWVLPFWGSLYFYCSVHYLLKSGHTLEDVAKTVCTASMGLFSLAQFIRLFKLRRFRSARFAVVVLAEQGDERALPLLASEWQRRPPRTRRAWNEQVAVALTQLLDRDQEVMPTYGAQDKLRAIGEKLLFRRRFQQNRDLTATETYLAIAIVRCLHRARGLANIEFVARAARLPRRVTAPNRVFVREIAQTLHLPGKPQPAVVETVTSPTRATPQPTAPIVQTTHRS